MSGKCFLCPRQCGGNREQKNGFCRSGNLSAIARADLHVWEEPCISGTNGSGTVFFSGCVLRCVFCQNHVISHESFGTEVSDDVLGKIFLDLQKRGAHNINLVNPSHFTDNIINAIESVKDKLKIPVVWNSGGYEKAETIKRLSGLVDVFLPDFKYVSSEISMKYSGASNYFEYAFSAISQMFEQAGYPRFDKDGMMTKGVLVRHLVLPSLVSESKKVIDVLSSNFDTQKLYLSIMCQYFPAHRANEFPEISRRLTTLEYQKVLSYAEEKGITHGFCQQRSSAKEEYVPQFYDNIDFSQI